MTWAIWSLPVRPTRVIEKAPAPLEQPGREAADGFHHLRLAGEHQRGQPICFGATQGGNDAAAAKGGRRTRRA